MYVNKCVKCGREFETKNPKRVICPDCLYPDKKMMINPTENAPSTEPQAQPTTPTTPKEPLNGYSTESQPQFYSSYSAGEGRPRPQRSYNSGYNQNRPQGGYQRRDNQGGYNRGYSQNRPQGGGFNRGGFNNRRPMNRNKAPKQLLVSKEQLEQIELLYKAMLPLPNPDAHEVIGEKIGLEPRKVFFGINLVRQKMMLPKLPFPKRKLAITPDQLNAIKMLYEPLLPLPPIGCHKIIAAQLKMDEWRVHVGIGLVRAQMGLERWNQDRPDAPEEFKNQKAEADKAEKPVKKTTKKATKAKAEEVPVETEKDVEETPVEEAPKKKRGRKPKVVEDTPTEE